MSGRQAAKTKEPDGWGMPPGPESFASLGDEELLDLYGLYAGHRDWPSRTPGMTRLAVKVVEGVRAEILARMGRGDGPEAG